MFLIFQRLFRLLTYGLVLLMFFSHVSLPVFADEEDIFDVEYFETSEMSPDAIRNAYLLLKLKQYLNSAESNYRSLEERIEETYIKIDETSYELEDMEREVAHLESLTGETETKIRNVQEQIAQKEIDIHHNLEAIAVHEIQRDEQKEALQSYLRLFYLEKSLYLNQLNEVNGLKLLLQPGSVSSVLKNADSLERLEQQAQRLIDDFQHLERTLRRENYDMTTKRNQLDHLNQSLEDEKRNLDAQLIGKSNLLQDLEVSDETYRELYASYKAAQEAILEEISLFKENIQLLDERISLATPHLSEADLNLIDEIKNESAEDFSIREAAQFLQLEWPVSPAYGLTAYFDDSSYTQTFGVAHHALDIRVAHGTVIFTPANAVVYKVYDPSKLDDPKKQLEYGHIILAHPKGVMTLYGHISSALVNEGDFVQRGQIIGLTGGTPHTPGAGVRTTGAHLHMEVWQNGIKVDPLEYLSLSEVPLDSLPERYLHLLEQQLQAELEAEGVDPEFIEAIEEEAESHQAAPSQSGINQRQ